MRYTTIIDISEIPQVMKNRNAVDIYVMACLKCGYHDYDRDCWRRSYRDIADDLGITLSACRHALATLEKYHLISREDDHWRVVKYIESQTITKRPKKTAAADSSAVQEREAAAARMREEATQRAAEKARVAAGGKTQYQMYIESLKEKAAAGDIEAAAALSRRKIKF